MDFKNWIKEDTDNYFGPLDGPNNNSNLPVNSKWVGKSDFPQKTKSKADCLFRGINCPKKNKGNSK